MKLLVFAKLGKISTHSFYLISALFFLCCMINILIKTKKFLVELMNQLPHFITQSISWYDGLTMDRFID